MDKTEKVMAELEVSADENVMNAAEKTTRGFCNIDILNGDFLSLGEAQEPVNELSKMIAIKSFMCGAKWKEQQLKKEAVGARVMKPADKYGEYTGSNYVIIAVHPDDKTKLEEGDKIKLIVTERTDV